jgi:hypothetical protein
MVHDMGNLVKIMGKGLRTEKFYDSILDDTQLDAITASPIARHSTVINCFRLGVEGMRLDSPMNMTYFALSIAR